MISPWGPQPTSSSTCAKEWYDVKTAMKALTPSSAHPSPFKADGMPSPLRRLPTGDDPKYIRIDPAHTFAIDGIGKDFLGSTITMLVRMGHFGGGNIPQSLQNGYAAYMAFCSAYRKVTTIQDFSYSTLKLPQNSFLILNLYPLFQTSFDMCMARPENMLAGPLAQSQVVYPRMNGFPRGLGKGHDAGIVGAWLAQEVQRVSPASVEIWPLFWNLLVKGKQCAIVCIILAKNGKQLQP